jgi:hypothetical protein
MISRPAVQSESALTAPAFFPSLWHPRSTAPQCPLASSLSLSLSLSIPGPAVPWKLRSECRLDNGRRRQLVKVRRRMRSRPSSPLTKASDERTNEHEISRKFVVWRSRRREEDGWWPKVSTLTRTTTSVNFFCHFAIFWEKRIFSDKTVFFW